VYFNYTVADVHGAYNSMGVEVTVRDVPGAPACGDALFAGPRNKPVAGALACTDRDGDALTYALAGAPEHGTAVVAPEGRFTYTPADGFRGSDAFTFTASDGTLVSRVATVHLDIGANHAPEASDGSVTLEEDAAASVTLAAADVDEDPLAYTIVAGPEHGTLTGDAPDLTYTPEPGFAGADSFAFVVNDGSVDSDEATVTITVEQVNDEASADDDAAHVDEDHVASVAVLDNDSPGLGEELEQVLVVTAIAQPAHGTAFAVAGGSVFYLPAANWNGEDAFSYTVCDDGSPSACATAQVAITVAPVNDRPSGSSGRVTLDEDAAPVTIDLADFVTDAETADPDLSYTVVSQPRHGSLSGSGRTLAYDSDEDVSGPDSFTFRVTDRGDPDACVPLPACSPPLTSSLRTVLIAIAPVNDAPELALDAPATLPANEIAQLAAVATDVDGDLLSFTWSADGGTLERAGARATLTSDEPATINVTATVTDGSSEATASATVTFENVAPEVDAGADVTVDEGAAVTLAASFADPGDEEHTVSVDWGDGSPPAAELDASHAFADDGEYTVTVRVTDEDGNVGEDTLTVTVENVAPQVDAGEDVAMDEGATVALAAGLDDPGADTHEVSVDWGDGSPPADELDASHAYADDGTHAITVRVTDDDGGVGEDTLEVTVRNVAPAVEAGHDSSMDEGGSLALDASLSDPGFLDTHGVSVDWGDGSTGSSLTDSHRYGDDGTYTVTVTARDDDGGADSLRVTVRNVVPRVDAGEDRSPDEGETLTLAPTFTDPGADTHTVSVDWGDGATGGLTHAYADDGTYTVAVTITDDDGGAGSDVARVTVRNVAPAVDAGADASLDEGGSLTLAATLTDPGTRDTHAVSVDWGDGKAGEGLTGAHRYDDNGTFTVTVTAKDDDGGVGSDRLLVQVRNVAPTVDAGPDRSAPWGVPVPLIGIAVDPSDADTAAGFSGGWRFGDGKEGSNLAALHAYAEPGRYDAVLTVTDKDGGSASDSVVVTIGRRATRLVWTGSTAAAFGFVELEAQLHDGADPATARLGGRTLVFEVAGQRLTAPTDATGAARTATPLPLAPGTHRVVVSFAEDDRYLASRVETTVVVAQSPGHVTGPGLTAQSDGGEPKGELQFEDYHSHEITALGVASDGRKAWLAGIGRDGRGFVAYVEDNGEPGKDDVYRLWIAGEPQTGDGVFSEGNIQIH
jgi:PKD repeat protein